MNKSEVLLALYCLGNRDGVAMGGGLVVFERAAKAILSAARRLSRYGVTRCNGILRWDAGARMMLASLTDADEARLDRLAAKAKAEAVAAVLALYGDTVTVSFNGDPRGAPIRLWAGASDESRSADCYIV